MTSKCDDDNDDNDLICLSISFRIKESGMD